MTENDEMNQTRANLHKLLHQETDIKLKKYEKKVLWRTMFPAMIFFGLIMGMAAAFWNFDLAMLFGGIIFSTGGALIVARTALPTDETILDIGITYTGINKHLVYELRKNKIIAIWGIYLIFIGYFCFSADIVMKVLGH
jgi:hypothetical protein